MYEKVSPSTNFVEREKKTVEFWKANNVFEQSIDSREGAENYTFYDGPPTANGKPHIGHVLTRVIKDMIPRYRAMKGYHILRKAGWDTHGLPVEIEVEKKLGLDGKEQIEEYGMGPFINECKECVWKYKGMWEDFSSTVGYWVDMDDPYITYSNDFIESEWWALKEIWNKKLLYKGFKTVWYCPRCGTPLSAQEVAQGYKLVKERSAIARFVYPKEEKTAFLAWTTTPWTLPSNVALCVNPAEEYIKVKAQDGWTYFIASALANKVLGEGTYEILETMVGSDLEGMEYEPLYKLVNPDKKCWYVTCDGYVTMGDGTGIVHLAPAFGDDDSRVGRKYDLPFVQLVDAQGNMTAGEKWQGLFVKKADPIILMDLDERGLLFDAPKFEHDYPHCWRCDTPLIQYARSSWFIKMTEVKDDLIRNNNTVNWIPESIGKGRFGDWLENVQDWGISRNRYWGTPLNIWECECGKQHAIGSIAELKEMSPNCPENIELHRPFIDEVTITCPDCGKQMHRVPEVIDCWFDSGSMPFAQWHYPFENKELFETQFPADFISEAVDQTRGWFYSLMAISTLLFNKAPYKNVIVLGHVLDKNGQKMSKSKGNAVDPFEALEKHGADAIRWYFYSGSSPWLPSRFHDDAVVEGQRKFMSTLWNTYAFFVLYANIDNFDATKYKLEYDKLPVMDKWVLSKLNTVVKSVDNCLENYKITETTRILQDFIDDLSNWYVRRSRERFWETGMPQDKINAYMTLYTCLVTFAKVCAPMIPFMAEDIYRNLVCTNDKEAPISVHLCDFPKADEALIDKELEERMDEVLKVVFLGRACRNGAAIKNRQPLSKMYVSADFTLPEFFTEIIEDELNLKAVDFNADVSSFINYAFKPQLKTVGPKYGKFLGGIRTYLSEVNGNEAMAQLNETGALTFEVNGTQISLTKEDLLISSAKMEGYESMSDYGITVVIDTNLTEELIEEGFVREIVSKIQTMRKDSGFEVMDNINITIAGSEKVVAIALKNADSITGDTLGKSLVNAEGENAKEWDINGEKVTISVAKIS